MPTIAEIKTSIKTALDNSTDFGSVYTEARENIADTSKPYITMWHTSGRSSISEMAGFTRRLGITLALVIPRNPAIDDIDMQVRVDTAVQDFLTVLEANFTLTDTVLSWTMEADYTVGYNPDDGSVVVTLPTMVEYES